MTHCKLNNAFDILDTLSGWEFSDIGPSEVRAALQTGCVANVVPTINTVIFSFSPLSALHPPLLFLDFYLT